ncbi:MAG: SEL1-like repeat protein, partial [Synergistales bacterium]|nr:SEL1-like repeat protein [Synergistales bacterium]MDY6429221.1 SEL1-like repeat protein [Synergistales bacterium]
FNLGCMYGRGEGVKKNHFEAIQWISKAAEQGNADALELMKSLTERQDEEGKF